MMDKVKQFINKIDNCLPQTQCTRCSYPRCRDYAEAIVAGQADINQCPPGGEVTIKALAKLLNVQERPLNEKYGKHETRKLAVIDEAQCIGCTLCIQACPVDAIVGGAKLMHTVIAQECTGCDLCVAPCPMDCIAMIDAPVNPQIDRSQWFWLEYAPIEVSRARQRTEARTVRIAKKKNTKKRMSAMPCTHQPPTRAAIDAAVARSKMKRMAQDKK